jgi:hypothetical protein
MSYYCNINEILIKYKKKLITIKQHPYYKALKNNNPEIYEKEMKSNKTQSCKITGTWLGFLQLKDIIIKNGIRSVCNEEIIYIRKNKDDITNYYCKHGRHRLCILYFIYGETINFKIKNNKCIGIKIKHDVYTTIKIKLSINNKI